MGDSSPNPLVLIGMGTSIAFSGLFYKLYREKKEEIKMLKKIPVFKPDDHLLKVLNASSHKRLQYVAVEGVVQADGEVLQSKFVPRCHGVIQKVVVEERWKYWNYLTRTWNSRTINKNETNNSVPFSLVQPGSYIADVHVKVQNPLEASGCHMERVYSKMRRAQEGLAEMVAQGLSGEKPMAMVESEQMLRVGSSLTGFGEVVLEGGRVVRLRAPQDGRSYILVPSDYRSFMDRHEASASMWKTLTAMTGLTGASLFAAVLYKAFGKQDDRSR
ncbi:mitochondrial ubiquitin ligase activator of nfkb 1-A [Xiphophorus couchianus]|uniref:RING-type E3 ubiquitin transferase n=1 Tax=Xiphophorus couchianus TaxID=32473 RepID=A0A3B5LHM3_9TELE|nr:mitochondrial ubiquitin ligase activator of nfkb 1-A-like [Xiphophorus couchianus]XP_027875292.1 mitochondrial ubiquitin ligase activator of nfkb 1-A-like [Xiphophorus couchianus]